jgi:hypothetical protein
LDDRRWLADQLRASAEAFAWAMRQVVLKTYQHTAEHTNDVLRLALSWDAMEADPAEAG